MKIAMSVLGFGALFAGFVQIPGVDDVVHRFLHGSFLDSKLYEQGPTTTDAPYRGLLIGGADLGARDRDRLLRLPRATAAGRRPCRSATAGLHDFLENEVVLRRGDRPALRPPRPRRRPLGQLDLRALRDPGPGRRGGDLARGASAGVRGAQSGYLRSYALLLVTGFAGLGLYFLCRLMRSAVVIRDLLWAPLTLGADRRAFPGRSPAGSRRSDRSSRSWSAIVVVAGFDPSGGLQHTVDASWIPTLGVRYQLGVDGISLFLVLLTAVLWLAATLWSAINPPERPRTLLPDVRACGDGGARSLPRSGPDPVRPLLRPDADPVLLPLRELGDGASGPPRGGRGTDPAAARDAQDVHLHAGRLAADAGRGDRHRGPRRGRRRRRLQHAAPGGGSARHRQPVLDLLVLRRRLPGEDAGLPAARLDARRLPGRAAAGARALLRASSPRSAPTASCASCCRSSRRRPTTSRR